MAAMYKVGAKVYWNEKGLTQEGIVLRIDSDGSPPKIEPQYIVEPTLKGGPRAKAFRIGEGKLRRETFFASFDAILEDQKSTEGTHMNDKLPEAPDFDLGPLLQLPNDFLKSDDPSKRAANAFMLSLACIFNDLKGIMWFAEQHTKWRQPDDKATGYNGQMSAMDVQIQRMAVGTIHELMEVLRNSTTELSHPDVQSAISKLTPQQKDAWDTLLSVAQKKEHGAAVKGPTMANFLQIVRNTTAYHYEKEYIMGGYEKWLHDAQKNQAEGNKYAYVSLGKNAEETRFYFADASTTFLFWRDLTNRGYKTNEIRPLISAVNKALRFAVANYIFP